MDIVAFLFALAGTLLAPFLSFVIFTFIPMGIGIAAIANAIPRVFVVIPVAYLGMYYAYVYHEDSEIEASRSYYQEENRSVEIAFDPKEHSLVFGKGLDGSGLIGQYDLPMIYNVGEGYSQEGYTAYHLVEPEVCTEMQSLPLENATMSLMGLGNRNSIIQHGSYRSGCILKISDEPTKPQYRLELEKAPVIDSAPFRLQKLTITNPQGVRQSMTAGEIAHLAPFPLPVLLCNFLGGETGCKFLFWRWDSEPLTPESDKYGTDRFVAASLNLRRTLSPVFDPVNQRELELMVEQRFTQLRLEQVTALDAVLRDPESNKLIGLGLVPGAVIQNRLPTIIEVVRDGAETAWQYNKDLDSAGMREKHNVMVFAHLIGELPEEEFDPLIESILPFYCYTPNGRGIKKQAALTNRLDGLCAVWFAENSGATS